MKTGNIELRRISVPLVTPFRTSFGTATERETTIVWVTTATAEGWAECAAEPNPLYSSDFLVACDLVIKDHLVPRPQGIGERLSAGHVAPALPAVEGHPMSKAVLETALLDAELKESSMSFTQYLGAVNETVPSGVSSGIMDSIDELLDAVADYLDQGYLRVKPKIESSWDVATVRAVRERFGNELLLQVDAKTAHAHAGAHHLPRLDPFDLLVIEQPLAGTDILGHADLAKIIQMPVCLDESIESAQDVVAAISLGACSVINVKPTRVEGCLEAGRIPDVAAAHGVPVWCGGMHGTGIGRA
ncbi:MAG: o-succinylbenzoate synthase, partial [Cryobacterium sp.]|nr:o-succinylbenzoate synthase [Cryobacterium sp.]